MEEKKLTDEEIVKALECCTDEENVNCEGRPLVKESCAIIRKYALDLIRRQKAEIERLTEEHERIAWSKQQYLDWVHGFLSTHTDMKDRGEDYKMFDRDWMCGVFWAKIEGSIEYIIDLENQRNELQKQVDELTDKNTELKGDYVKGYEAGVDEGWDNAVKDTAKEIIEELDLFFKGTTFRQGYEFKKIEEKLKEMAKRNGVEVE